jgi:[protein-PII] uridylyltransferase
VLKERIEGFIGSCWDVGLEIGSSVRTAAECLEEARREMMRVREGDKATIISGALAGLVVDVGQITGSEAWLQLPFGGRIKASIKSLERHAAMG